MVRIGTCGWNYLSPGQFLSDLPREKLLQSYARLFDTVEVNSTFYRLPGKTTPDFWRKQVNERRKDFEFTVKAPKLITHTHKFSPHADWAFESIKDVARKLQAKIILFQTSEYFVPSKENIQKLESFFTRINREDFILVLEVRWAENWKKEIVFPLFKDLKLEQCIDPLRQDWFYAESTAYFRLHGFGRPMYNYAFSDAEIRRVYDLISSLDYKEIYVFFNNSNCYADALKLKGMM